MIDTTDKVMLTKVPEFDDLTEAFSQAQMRNEGSPVDALVPVLALEAELFRQYTHLNEAEKLMRSELTLAVQANPALIDGKVTEKTVEAFYRAAKPFVELNRAIAEVRWQLDTMRNTAEILRYRIEGKGQ